MEAFDVRSEDVLHELAVSRQLIREVLRDLTFEFCGMAAGLCNETHERAFHPLGEEWS